jgi:hypothetical protein
MQLNPDEEAENVQEYDDNADVVGCAGFQCDGPDEELADI